MGNKIYLKSTDGATTYIDKEYVRLSTFDTKFSILLADSYDKTIRDLSKYQLYLLQVYDSEGSLLIEETVAFESYNFLLGPNDDNEIKAIVDNSIILSLVS